MVYFPNAKINLGLRILRKRPDGYHDLETCLVPVPWRDMLEMIASDTFSFQSSGLPIPGNTSDNLCVRAYHLLRSDFELPPVQMHLHKIIPMGAGLGGGSADAVAVLIGLNEQFGLTLDTAQLEGYAVQLGSDCPFFVQNRVRMAYETGTTLEDIDLDLSGYHLVLVYPNVAVSTAEAYANVRPALPNTSLKETLESQPLATWKDWVVNDFEASVFPQYPKLSDIKSALYQAGAVYASMSGSGSALYGLFNEAVELPQSLDEYPVWQGAL